jgi:hypothetical protein
VMMFLHAPSAAGLSTPVDGMEGVVPVVVTAADAPPMLDVRRLGTRVGRGLGSPLVAGKVSLQDAVAAVRDAREPVMRGFAEPKRPVVSSPVRFAAGYDAR